MNPFNTARSDSHKTKFFENVSSDSFKQTSVTPLIIGRFMVFSERDLKFTFIIKFIIN